MTGKTIYEALAEKLGREPTHQEIKDEMRRVLGEHYCKLSERKRR